MGFEDMMIDDGFHDAEEYIQYLMAQADVWLAEYEKRMEEQYDFDEEDDWGYGGLKELPYTKKWLYGLVKKDFRDFFDLYAETRMIYNDEVKMVPVAPAQVATPEFLGYSPVKWRYMPIANLVPVLIAQEFKWESRYILGRKNSLRWKLVLTPDDIFKDGDAKALEIINAELAEKHEAGVFLSVVRMHSPVISEKYKKWLMNLKPKDAFESICRLAENQIIINPRTGLPYLWDHKVVYQSIVFGSSDQWKPIGSEVLPCHQLLTMKTRALAQENKNKKRK